MRDLIEALEISEATFFNYFPSKSDLMDAWLGQQLANAFAELDPAPRSVRALLRPRVRGLARDAASAVGLEASAWERGRLQLAVSSAARHCELAEVFRRASGSGELRRDIDGAELAELWIGAVAQAIAVARETGAEARAIRAAELVLDGARRRHERVQLGKGAPESPESSSVR